MATSLTAPVGTHLRYMVYASSADGVCEEQMAASIYLDVALKCAQRMPNDGSEWAQIEVEPIKVEQ